MIKLGRHSYACEPIIKGTLSDVIVGNYTSIAENVTFDCGFQHRKEYVTTFPLSKIWDELPSNVTTKGDIIIGSDVWIGTGCIIMSGAKIGNGAIIGAGATVRSEIPPFVSYTGNYVFGKLYFERFKMDYDKFKDTIKLLEEIAWWNWSDERVLANASLLLSEDIDNFIKNHI